MSVSFHATALTGAQSTLPGFTPPQGELLLINGVQWRCCRSAVPSSDTGLVDIWRLTGSTWSLVVSVDPSVSSNPVTYAAGGTTIFICFTTFSGDLNMWRYETSSSTLTGPYTAPVPTGMAGYGGNGASDANAPVMGLMADGTFVVVAKSIKSDFSTDYFVGLKFNPSGNTWTASGSIVQVSSVATGDLWLGYSGPVQRSTGLMFFFYAKSADGTNDIEIHCRTVDGTLSLGTDEIAATSTVPNIVGANSQAAALAVGIACITQDPASPEVLIPFLSSWDGSHFGQLQVARANCSTSPAFAVETVDTLGAGSYFVTFAPAGAGVPSFDCSLGDQAGTVFCFAVAGNDVQNGGNASQLNVYTSTASGAWVPQGAALSLAGRGITGAFPALDPNGNIAAVISTEDWTIWNGGGNVFAGLIVDYLYQGAAPGPTQADCSALALATRNFSILTAQITVGIADAGLTTANASGNPANADLGLTGSFTIGATGIVTVAGMVRWENAQNLSNAGTLTDTGLSSNDPLVTAISLNQAKLNAYLAMPGAPLANTLTSETVNLNPGVTVCSSSLTCSDVIFNLTGGATDSYTIVILGDWTMDGVTLTGILSPNIVWAVQGSIYPDGANVIPGVFYFSTDFTVQGGTLTVNPGRLLGSAGSALTVQDGTALSITTPVCIAAVAQTPATIGGGPGTPGPNGVPFIISACKRRNDWDWCLLREELRLREICFPPICNIPEEYRNLLPWDDTFGAIPPQAIPFLRPKGLLTPAPAAGDQVVVSFSLPRGYDGILSGIYQFYTGTGFINGSGDILWRIQLNQRYVKDLSNNPFSLGSPQYPFPMTEGQLLLAGQTVRYIVNVPNLSGQIQVGNSQIVCALLGFAWPRG